MSKFGSHTKNTFPLDTPSVFYVVGATSHDPLHPPEYAMTMIPNNIGTKSSVSKQNTMKKQSQTSGKFWSTTGGFPQEIILETEELCKVHSLKLATTGAAYLTIRLYPESHNCNEVAMSVVTLEKSEPFNVGFPRLQRKIVHFSDQPPCRRIKIVIEKVYNQFATLSDVHVNSSPIESIEETGVK